MHHFVGKIFTVMIICGFTLIITGCGISVDLAESQTEEIGVSDSTPKSELPIEIEDTSPLPTELPAEIAEPTVITPTSPLVEPTIPPLSADIAPLPGSEVPLATALADLADKINVPTDQISLVSIEAIEWNDASLGCPQEGFMYAQVITPGYLMVFEVEGVQYTYHTDKTDNVVHCDR